MKGHYNRYITCEKCGTEFFVGNRACPQCGFERQLSPAVQARDRAKEAPNPRGPYKTGAAKGSWTVSLVNGKKQIAATVSDAVAKRIIGMLF